jgi:hypothetical protein
MSVEGMHECGRVWRDPRSGRIYRASAPAVFEAQMIRPTDVSAIEAKVVLEEVLGLAVAQYVLRRACRVVSVPQLTVRIDVATKLAGREKVPALGEAELSAETYTPVTLDLWKNVVHVAISDEAMRRAAHPIMNLHIEDAARDLARMEEKQVAEEMETATAVSGSDWGSASNNPFDDIVKVIAAIEGEGYPVEYMAAHPLAWGDFLSNPYVRGTLQGVQYPSGRVFPVPGLPGVTGYSSSLMTSTLAVVGSRDALVFGEGPTEAAQYRNEAAGYTAYVVRQWLQPRLVVQGAIRRITGVHA